MNYQNHKYERSFIIFQNIMIVLAVLFFLGMVKISNDLYQEITTFRNKCHNKHGEVIFGECIKDSKKVEIK